MTRRSAGTSMQRVSDDRGSVIAKRGKGQRDQDRTLFPHAWFDGLNRATDDERGEAMAAQGVKVVSVSDQQRGEGHPRPGREQARPPASVTGRRDAD
jgi:hypothetical protein